MSGWVWIVVEGNWRDYEGGGDAIQSVHSSEAAAMDELRRLLREEGRQDAKPDSDGCYVLEGSPSNRWLAINRWAVR